MTPNWQQEIIKAVDEAFAGNQGIFLDSGTAPLTELRSLTARQASLQLPGAGNSVANQVQHLLTTIAMHQPQFMGGEYPDMDWQADWNPNGDLSEEEWQAMLAQLESGYTGLKQWIANPTLEQNQEYAAASVMAVTHLAFHIGQIRHAAGYAQQA